jgi:hypothetical protein
MRKSMKPVGLVLGAATVIAAAIAVWFLFIPGSRPATPIPPPEKPAMIDAYERLLAAYKAKQAGQAIDVNLDPFPEDALDIMAAYEQLFTHVTEALGAAGIDDMEEVLHKRPYERTDAEKSKAAQFLAANQKLIREIRQVADRGGPVYPLDLSEGFLTKLPHLAQMRSCARLLSADAVVKGTNGEHKDAVDDIIAGMKLGDALAQEPILMTQLVRIAIYGIMSRAVQDSFDAGELTPDFTEELLAHIAQADKRSAFAESLRGEFYSAAVHFSDLRRGGSVKEFVGAPSGAPDTSLAPSDVLMWTVYVSPAGGTWRNMDQQTYAAMIGRLSTSAEFASHEAVRQLRRIERDIDELPRNRIASRTLLRPLPRACKAQARHEAVLDLMQMGLLIEQYNAQNGSYPATLDAIVPDLGGSVPVDPFSGEEYHYQPSDDGSLLYSVGQNLVDDGGKHDYREGDIVWRGKKKEAAEAE